MSRPIFCAATRSFSNTATKVPISPVTCAAELATQSSHTAWQAYRAAETARLSSFRLKHLQNPHRCSLPTMLQYTAFNPAALRTFKEDRETHIAARRMQKTEDEKETLDEVAEGM